MSKEIKIKAQNNQYFQEFNRISEHLLEVLNDTIIQNIKDTQNQLSNALCDLKLKLADQSRNKSLSVDLSDTEFQENKNDKELEEDSDLDNNKKPELTKETEEQQKIINSLNADIIIYEDSKQIIKNNIQHLTTENKLLDSRFDALFNTINEFNHNEIGIILGFIYQYSAIDILNFTTKFLQHCQQDQYLVLNQFWNIEEPNAYGIEYKNKDDESPKKKIKLDPGIISDDKKGYNNNTSSPASQLISQLISNDNNGPTNTK